MFISFILPNFAVANKKFHPLIHFIHIMEKEVLHLSEIIADIMNTEERCANLEVQGEVLTLLVDAAKALKQAKNDMQSIMRGENPYS